MQSIIIVIVVIIIIVIVVVVIIIIVIITILIVILVIAITMVMGNGTIAKGWRATLSRRGGGEGGFVAGEACGDLFFAFNPGDGVHLSWLARRRKCGAVSPTFRGTQKNDGRRLAAGSLVTLLVDGIDIQYICVFMSMLAVATLHLNVHFIYMHAGRRSAVTTAKELYALRSLLQPATLDREASAVARWRCVLEHTHYAFE